MTEPGQSVTAPGRAERVTLYPSFIMVAGWHYRHDKGYHATIYADDPGTWLTLGWSMLSLWHRDEDASLVDAEWELVPLLDKAVPRWKQGCPECRSPILSSLHLLEHLNYIHNWSLHTLEAWLRLVMENRIVLPEEGAAIPDD
jgi:hypothetical protein